MKSVTLILLLALGIGLLWFGAPLTRWENTRDQQRVLGGLRFIEEQIEALGPEDQSVDAFHIPSVEKDKGADKWVFTGIVELHKDTVKTQRWHYIAELTSLCNIYSDFRCWSLESLDLTDRLEIDARVPLHSSSDGIESDLGRTSEKASAPKNDVYSSKSSSMGFQDKDLLHTDSQSKFDLSGKNKIITINNENESLPPIASGKKENNEEIILEIPKSPETLLSLIQRQLNNLGYQSGPADGKMGPRTRTAIEAYQRDHDLRVDGEPSHNLMEHLAQTLKPPKP